MAIPVFNSALLGAKAAAVCHAFWGPNRAQDAVNEAIARFGVPQRSTYAEHTANTPAYVILEYTDHIIHVYAGSQVYGHVAGFLLGMSTAQGSPQTAPFNRYCMNLVNNVDAVFAIAGMTRSKPHIICGHSIGGAVATLMGLYMRTLPAVWGPTQVVSFGAPKCARQDIGANSTYLPLQRWMNAGDPVPRIYPNFLESQILAIIMPTEMQLAGYGTGQFHGGTVINTNLTMEAKILPDSVGGDFAGELAAWWWRISGQVGHPHHATVYASRLFQIAAQQPAAVTENPPRTNSGEPQRQRPTLRELNAQIREDETQYVDAPDNEPGRGAPPGFKFFRYEKVNGLYAVFLLDRHVCTFAKRNKARKMVAGGNRMAANYVRSPLGDTSEMTTAMEALLEAVDAGDFN